MSEQSLNRRKFLTIAGATGISLGIAACAAPPIPSADIAGQAFAPAATTVTPDPTQAIAAMDQAHEQGITSFIKNLAENNKVFWPPEMEFKLEGDTKVAEITVKPVKWQVAPDKIVDTYSYNGIIPGPTIRVTEGDKLRFKVKNELPESTSIHWHGVHVPNKQDGVPFITQPPIQPGETFVYEFTAKNPGSHMYHSHHNSADQVTRGLLAAFIIDPKDPGQEPAFDSDYTMILNDYNVGLTINGKSFPATGAIVAKSGEKIRIRFMNEGLQIHPMHTHGYYMTVTHKDGFKLDSPYKADVLNIAPGERYDVIIEANEPGVWALHCHILTHAESPHGMFGMVSALIVNET